MQVAGRFLTGAFVFLFASLGTMGMVRTLQPLRFSRGGVDGTTDEVIDTTCGVRGGAESIRQAVAGVPMSELALVVGPGHDRMLTEVYYTVSYLLWPRQVWALGVAEEGDESSYSFMPKGRLDPGCLFFYAIDPPLPLRDKSEKLGERLSRVRKQRTEP